jgi:lipopolysaccharide transport system permease protein
LLLVAVALGIGIWLAVLNLYYRDVAHALPFVTQIVFFMTPVAYSSALVPAKWRALFILNPMVGVLECWRWALFGKALDIAPWHLAVSLGAGAVILAAGLFYFAHKEPVLADVGDT